MSKLLQCSRQRCAKPPRFDGLCAIHARKLADVLFSKFIRARDKMCRVCELEPATQCGHLISRRYMALRWNPENAIGICVFDHKRYTENPLAWDQWCAEHVGSHVWDSMKFRAMRGGMPDLGVIIADLKLLLAEVAA